MVMEINNLIDKPEYIDNLENEQNLFDIGEETLLN